MFSDLVENFSGLNWDEMRRLLNDNGETTKVSKEKKWKWKEEIKGERKGRKRKERERRDEMRWDSLRKNITRIEREERERKRKRKDKM